MYRFMRNSTLLSSPKPFSFRMTAENRIKQLTSILNNSQMRMSTSSNPLDESEQTDVLHQKILGARFFTLNRPNALNALNLSMVRNMTPQLQAWDLSDLCHVVILKGAGKAFCAGGDVKSVIELAQKKDPLALRFFEEEYQLNHLIATLKTPFVAILDGVTMGGGVGLSVHAPFRIATENTVFAMPETKIGFFPDVGGSFFLPRMDGELGTYLALTGARLKGEDVFRAGIASHFVPSKSLTDLEERLMELESSDYGVINAAIEEVADSDPHHHFSLGGEIRKIIDKCFCHNNLEEIVKALDEDPSEFAKMTKDTLLQMSPTSLRVTLEQLRRGKEMSIAECFKMEYRLAQQFLVTHDFHEGVSSLLITKTNSPSWNPPTLQDLSPEILQIFFDMPKPFTLELLNSTDFFSYPHAYFALPSEEEVRNAVMRLEPNAGSLESSRKKVIDILTRERHGKRGVREKVEEVLDRRISEKFQWIE
ncbi:mitochondrial 37S ribosomal protein mS47 [Calcarisporiella thermophila]|uniref:mitochondrial 37S ribosomal protein mS47 n=1 Tax=Calcarisporiella thermophila TaxID=911321 RepID=UPI0037430D39